MPTWFLILLVGAALVSSVATFSVSLWLACKLLRIEQRSFRHCLATAGLLVGLNVVIGSIALAMSELITGGGMGLSITLWWITALASFALPWLVVKWRHETSIGRAFFAWLFAMALNLAVTLPMAFVLRVTTMEAFVVPTGAMAPAIHGAHAAVECENCGHRYSINMSDIAANAEAGYPGYLNMNFPEKTGKCPMCGQLSTMLGEDSIRAGDRILADKIATPQRWDIIVFRYPEDPDINYVKRLVGLPGERIVIAGGDVFAAGQRLRKAPHDRPLLWFPVHDTKYIPRTRLDGPRWAASADDEAAWREDDETWQLNGLASGGASIAFGGAITDELAYNRSSVLNTASVPPAFVGDVRVSCEPGEMTGPGDLEFGWEFDGWQVTAATTASGRVTLTALSPTAESVEEGETAQGKLPAPVEKCERLAFSIRDGAAYVTADGVIAASLSFLSDDVPDPEAAVSQQPCRLTISARDCSVALARITVERDVYYRTSAEMGADPFTVPGSAVSIAEVAPAGPAQGYIVLGDNSTRSKDSRFFGRVPQEHYVGVARWTYWPKSRWRSLRD